MRPGPNVYSVTRALNELPGSYRGPSLVLNFLAQQYRVGNGKRQPLFKAFGDLITFTRSTGGARFNASGSYEWVGSNLPRLSYDPVTLEPRGLLVEEQRVRLNTVSLAPVAAQNVTVTAQAYTLSFYGTGSITISGAHTATVVGDGAFPTRKMYTFTPTAGTVTLTPTGTVQYLQLEAGINATSAIQGEGSQVTRAADVPSINLLSPWYLATAGTLVVKLRTGVTQSTNQAVVSLDDTTTNERIQIRRISTGEVTTIIVDGGVTQASITGAAVANSTIAKWALAWAPNDIAFVTNGSLVSTDTSATLPTPTRLVLGAGAGLGALNGHVQAVEYYPRRLTTAELIRATT